LKLYNSLGPNPRLVRMFMLEKGIPMPETVEIDILGGENRRQEFVAKNPTGQMPALELDDGTVLAETVAICEYLEERQPEPALIGATPEERASTRMWTRRVEFKITVPLTDGFRYAEGHAMFKDRMRLIPQAADDLKAMAQEGIGWLDALMEGREFIAGPRPTLADVLLYAFLDFAGGIGQPLDRSRTRVAAWFDRMAARPSAEASLHPVAKAGGMRA
jgi:glutathione S-transferase